MAEAAAGGVGEAVVRVGGEPAAALAEGGQVSPSRSLAEQPLQQARELMTAITSAGEAPEPGLLHRLADVLEEEERRYQRQVGFSYSNTRSSYPIGRLVNALRDNDDFYELVSSRLLLEPGHSVACRAAAARLLLACVSCWLFRNDLEEEVFSKIKEWVAEETAPPVSANESPRPLQRDQMERELLRTYATGLLAVALQGEDVVDDVVRAGLVTQLIRFLRLRTLGLPSNEAPATAGSSGGLSGAAICNFEEQSTPLDLPRRRQGHQETSGTTSAVLTPILASDRVMDDMRVHDGVDIVADGPVVGQTVRNKVKVDGATSAGGEFDREGADDARMDASDEEIRGTVGSGRWRTGRPREGPGSPIAGLSERRARRRPQERRSGGVRDWRNGVSSPPGIVECAAVDSASKAECISQDVEGTAAKTIGMENGSELAIEMVGAVDISALVKTAMRAAQAEARFAKAPSEVVDAAAEAAADTVRVAASEAHAAGKTTEEILSAALAAAEAVANAAEVVIANKSKMEGEDLKDAGHEQGKGPDKLADHEIGNVLWGMERDSILALRELYCVQCLAQLGEYLEVLGPVLQERGVDVCLALLKREDIVLLAEVLKLVCALAAHRKFAALFVDRGGVQLLLEVPRVPHSWTGLSVCLFALASLQGVMDRVCALPPPTLREVVALALQLLGTPHDTARKHAALFFGAAFVFPRALEEFDEQSGLEKLMDVLRAAARLRTGGGSGSVSANAVPSSLARMQPLGTYNERTAGEVLTSAGRQVAHHACVALRQYLRTHLALLLDTLRPAKGAAHRGDRRGSASTGTRPVDNSAEAVENAIAQMQKDRRLGQAFVRARWPALEHFHEAGGIPLLLELTQVSPGDRAYGELSGYALGVLQVATLMPFTHRAVVTSQLSNERSGMAAILDAASDSPFADPEVMQTALLVLSNLVCPPPSLCSRVPVASGGPTATGNTIQSQIFGPTNDTAEKGGKEAGRLDLGSAIPGQNADRFPGGERRISLGPGAGGPAVAAYMEQGYRLARDAIRASNGIKILIQLLGARTLLPPASSDCIRALACRVLLGLARDPAISHILTKLQVGRTLSELLRDANRDAAQGGSGVAGGPEKWPAEFHRAALELITMTTNAGRASTAAASEAAAPTLRRIERAAIAAATPISFPPKELLQLIHAHLLASGLPAAASMLLQEARLTPLPSLGASAPTVSLNPPAGVGLALNSTLLLSPPPSRNPEATTGSLEWPRGRCPRGFLSVESRGGMPSLSTPAQTPSTVAARWKRATGQSQSKKGTGTNLASPSAGSGDKGVKDSQEGTVGGDAWAGIGAVIPLKRKAVDLTSTPLVKKVCIGGVSTEAPIANATSPAVKVFEGIATCPVTPARCFPTSGAVGSSTISEDATARSSNNAQLTPIRASVEAHPFYSQYLSTPSLNLSYPATPTGSAFAEPRPAGVPSGEPPSLDAIVTAWLKQQHKQCPAPITTLPPLSLLHPHVCPEPRHSLDAPLNITRRLAGRQRYPPTGGAHGQKHDRHFVYSRFRPWRTCRDDAAMLISAAFLGHAGKLVTGSSVGDIRVFDTVTGLAGEVHSCHESPVVFLQVASQESSRGAPLLLSSTRSELKLWDGSDIGVGSLHTFTNCRAGRFSHSASIIAAIGTERAGKKEVMLYDVGSGKLQETLEDASGGGSRNQWQAGVHFSPLDELLLWNGTLWDPRIPRPIHRFDQFTDYGGGGFHPAGNEVILNSEVWDLRARRLLRSVPSLDQTAISFNTTGDVIYASLRRSSDEIMAALHGRRRRHPLYMAFRTLDAVEYTDIATVPVDRCVLDLALEPSDSYLAVVAMDEQEEMESAARLYEVGRRRPLDDDSDIDLDDTDGEEDGEEEDDGMGVAGPAIEVELGEDGPGENGEDEGGGRDAIMGSSSDGESDDDIDESLLGLLSEDEDGDEDFSSEHGSSDSDYPSDGEFDDMLQSML